VFTILLVAQLGGLSDPTNCACAHDRKLRCRNRLFKCSLTSWSMFVNSQTV